MDSDSIARGSVLQLVAARETVCCNMMQCVAECYHMLQCVALGCIGFLCVAVRGNALQCVAVRCNAYMHQVFCTHILSQTVVFKDDFNSQRL